MSTEQIIQSWEKGIEPYRFRNTTPAGASPANETDNLGRKYKNLVATSRSACPTRVPEQIFRIARRVNDRIRYFRVSEKTYNEASDYIESEYKNLGLSGV